MSMRSMRCTLAPEEEVHSSARHAACKGTPRSASPHRAAARGAPGYAVPASYASAFVHCRGRRLRARVRVLGESFTQRLAPLRPPIPLEGGYERALEHNAERFMRAWLTPSLRLPSA